MIQPKLCKIFKMEYEKNVNLSKNGTFHLNSHHASG